MSRGDEIHTWTNRFIIVQRYREGGNAVSFVAFCSGGPLAGIPCVLKVYDNLGDKVRHDHFIAEADLATQLNHPSVLKVIDAGILTQSFRDSVIRFPFHVTRLYSTTLLQRLRERMPLTERLLITTQLLSAIGYLESLEDPIVHRDIKPSNIFIEANTCVLGDFGLFIRQSTLDRVMENDASRLAIARGMPIDYRIPDLLAYASSKIPVSASANVYQLGLVLFELFAGTRFTTRSDFGFELDKVPRIAGHFGTDIRLALVAMLNPVPGKRISIHNALLGFTTLAKSLCLANIDINGRLF